MESVVVKKIPIDVRETLVEEIVDMPLNSKKAEKMPSGLTKAILLYWQRNRMSNTGVERLLEAGAMLEPEGTLNISNRLGLPEAAKMFEEAGSPPQAASTTKGCDPRPVKFGLEFVPREPFWKTVYHAIQADKGPFDYLWVADHYTNRNVYVTLSTILIHTDRIIVGTGVTNPYLVNPLITAGAIASLNEIAPGRVVCGIGAGDRTTLEQAGIPQVKPLAAVKESVHLIRLMIKEGGVTDFRGEIFRVPGAKFGLGGNPVPIYIGAQGPKMLKLAAEIGDGVLINSSHPRDLEEAVRYIEEGTSKANRPLNDLDIAAYASFSVDEKPEKAFKAAVPAVAFIMARYPDTVLEKHGIKPERGAKLRENLIKGNFGEAFAQVTPDMVDSFAVWGNPDVCTEKISTILKTGITQFVAGPPIGPNIRRSIDILATKIIPNFRGSRGLT